MEEKNIFIVNGRRVISEETPEFPFLELKEGDNIYTVCSFGICGNYPTVYISENETPYRLPKEFMESVKLFLVIPPNLPGKFNFIKENNEYYWRFVD